MTITPKSDCIHGAPRFQSCPPRANFSWLLRRAPSWKLCRLGSLKLSCHTPQGMHHPPPGSREELMAWPSAGSCPKRPSTPPFLGNPLIASPTLLAAVHTPTHLTPALSWPHSAPLAASTPPMAAPVQTLLLSPEGRPGSPQLATFPSCPMSDKSLQHAPPCTLLPQHFRSPDVNYVMFPLLSHGGPCDLPLDLSATLPSPAGDLGRLCDGHTQQLILVPSTPAPQPGTCITCHRIGSGRTIISPPSGRAPPAPPLLQAKPLLPMSPCTISSSDEESEEGTSVADEGPDVLAGWPNNATTETGPSYDSGWGLQSPSVGCAKRSTGTGARSKSMSHGGEDSQLFEHRGPAQSLPRRNSKGLGFQSPPAIMSDSPAGGSAQKRQRSARRQLDLPQAGQHGRGVQSPPQGTGPPGIKNNNNSPALLMSPLTGPRKSRPPPPMVSPAASRRKASGNKPVSKAGRDPGLKSPCSQPLWHAPSDHASPFAQAVSPTHAVMMPVSVTSPCTGSQQLVPDVYTPHLQAAASQVLPSSEGGSHSQGNTVTNDITTATGRRRRPSAVAAAAASSGAPGGETRVQQAAWKILDLLKSHDGPMQEIQIRTKFGNCADVSKGLRLLLLWQKVGRTGKGGRHSPYQYQVREQN
ncbi:hypothetical protein WJX73_007977 [Symbiochloris irregularis]|uniref:Uncharacterized protein n=1 Tax=Symbiochloris irregularis TaxID=706552 RepID=A0AAW1NW59_9CHLO